jgi:hypothetical protein
MKTCNANSRHQGECIVTAEPGKPISRDVPYSGADDETKDRAFDALMRQWRAASDIDAGASDPVWETTAKRIVEEQLEDEHTRRLEMAKRLVCIYQKRAQHWADVAASLAKPGAA